MALNRLNSPCGKSYTVRIVSLTLNKRGIAFSFSLPFVLYMDFLHIHYLGFMSMVRAEGHCGINPLGDLEMFLYFCFCPCFALIFFVLHRALTSAKILQQAFLIFWNLPIREEVKGDKETAGKFQ
ncbi:hypothetical protein FKM82_019826 [Ascaphus truei]